MIEREWNLAKRKGYPLSIIIIDIDDFKNYNDEYGHLKGDEVLMKVANSLKSCLRRATDHIFRYSGEKFAAILPDTDKPGSKVVSENMRLAIENLNIEHKKSETADHLTISIGTSTEIPTNKKEIDTFISEAEEALLKAKDKGKNKTIQYSNLKENDS
jgi:diguanylate cyclase (GGDEF)-like protein